MASAASSATKSRSSARANSRAPRTQPIERDREPRLPRMSEFSSPQVPNSGWASENFMLGAGMVIIQPSTQKIVIIRDGEGWFLPRGRKDIGESVEMTALREAYEESGYRVEFLPLYAPTHAPPPPSNRAAKWEMNTEPLYTTITHWPAGRGNRKVPGEYITFWYAGQIPHDAVHTSGTGMHNEQGYIPHLCTYDEAMAHLGETQRDVVYYIWEVYLESLRIQIENEEYEKIQTESLTTENIPASSSRSSAQGRDASTYTGSE